MITLGLVLFVSSALFAYLLNKILYQHSQTSGKERGSQDIVRWASTSKPTVGGISFYITFILAALVFFLTQKMDNQYLYAFFGLVASLTLGFFIGLQDDAYNTRPLLKLLGQITCGVILIIFDVHIDLFHIAAIDYFLTIFWVVGIMNSINLLDNMDGVTATVSLTIVAASLLVISLFAGNIEVNPFIFTMVALCGSLVGFLVLNWNPSKIYMGDTGSQFLGVLLAFIGIKFFWNLDILSTDRPVATAMKVIVPSMVFIVPLMDTTFVTVARIMRGQSPFVGGKDHLTHHLSYLGVPDSRVPLVLGLVSLGSGALAMFSVRYIVPWNSYHSLFFAAYTVIVFGIFYFLFKRGEKVGHIKERFAKTLNRVFEEQKQKESKPTAAEKQPS